MDLTVLNNLTTSSNISDNTQSPASLVHGTQPDTALGTNTQQIKEPELNYQAPPTMELNIESLPKPLQPLQLNNLPSHPATLQHNTLQQQYIPTSYPTPCLPTVLPIVSCPPGYPPKLWSTNSDLPTSENQAILTKQDIQTGQTPNIKSNTPHTTPSDKPHPHPRAAVDTARPGKIWIIRPN